MYSSGPEKSYHKPTEKIRTTSAHSFCPTVVCRWSLPMTRLQPILTCELALIARLSFPSNLKRFDLFILQYILFLLILTECETNMYELSKYSRWRSMVAKSYLAANLSKVMPLACKNLITIFAHDCTIHII